MLKKLCLNHCGNGELVFNEVRRQWACIIQYNASIAHTMCVLVYACTVCSLLMLLMKEASNSVCNLFFPASGSSPSRAARLSRADAVQHVAAGDKALQQSTPPRCRERNIPAKPNTAEHTSISILVSSPPTSCKAQLNSTYQEDSLSTHTQAWTGCCRVSSQLTRPHTSVTKAHPASFSDSHVHITPKQTNSEETQSGAVHVHKLTKQTVQEEHHEGKM